MTEDLKNISEESTAGKNRFNRRDIIKGLLGVPVLGLVACSLAEAAALGRRLIHLF